MSASVKLTVHGGPIDGQQLVFSDRSFCTVGRSHSCCLRVPPTADFQEVSRRHCLFDIDPPNAKVCDLSSLNGTFVNETKIGQRTVMSSLGRLTRSPAVSLRDGDRVRLGQLVLRVTIGQPAEKEGQLASLPN